MHHKSKKDGYEQIAAIFEETANNEKEHAKMWFKRIKWWKSSRYINKFKRCKQVEKLRMDRYV